MDQVGDRRCTGYRVAFARHANIRVGEHPQYVYVVWMVVVRVQEVVVQIHMRNGGSHYHQAMPHL